MKKIKQKKLDIIISGGGLSGCLMALSLADVKKSDGSLLSIAIVETNKAETNKPEVNQPETRATQSILNNKPSLFDDRVLALSHGSAKYLDEVGAWKYLTNDVTAIESIDISDRGHYGKARLQAKEHGVLALGYVIEMALIGKALLKALSNKKNIQWYSPDTITDIDWYGDDNNNITVTLASKKQLTTSLLLACDGVKSPCRKFANINVRSSDYQQVALIANVATQKPHNNKAYERFTQYGPIAMLPLKTINNTHNKRQDRCSLVWTMPPALADEISTLNDNEFKQKLALAFGEWLGEIVQVGKRDIYPLVLLQAQQQTFHRMALIGNASHTIHPIAGQGFNLGLRDVKKMALLIKDAVKNKQDIGCFSVLNNYEQDRKKDQKQVIQLTDSLVTLFSNNLPPLIAGRTVGLKVLNYLRPLKNALVNKTMGY